jgi:Rrf2 family nitric oxide-sensitive transcriptional repressor
VKHGSVVAAAWIFPAARCHDSATPLDGFYGRDYKHADHVHVLPSFACGALMRLTAHTDFALRTLMYLAVTPERATVGQVAQLYGVSAHHMAKVVNHLARLGYLRSVRGIGGGIELARSPQDIRLGDVIQLLEGNTHLLECVSTDDVCAIQTFCKLKGVFAEAERLQMDYLKGITLADVVPTKRQLATVSAP